MKDVTTRAAETLGQASREFEPCIWMLAGVVDYKLCDHNYNCESCAFDRVMHSGAVPSESGQVQTQATINSLLAPAPKSLDSKHSTTDFQGYEHAATLFYHPGHAWARIEEGGKVRVGLDHVGQQTLGRLYSIELPATGTVVKQGEQCWQATYQAGEVQMASPVDGIVISVNQTLRQSPSRINRDPYGDGWAFMVEPANLVECLANLYFGPQARIQHQLDIATLNQNISSLLNPNNFNAGVTLPDGGISDLGWTSELAPAQVRQVIESFFSVPNDAINAKESENIRPTLKGR